MKERLVDFFRCTLHLMKDGILSLLLWLLCPSSAVVRVVHLSCHQKHSARRRPTFDTSCILCNLPRVLHVSLKNGIPSSTSLAPLPFFCCGPRSVPIISSRHTTRTRPTFDTSCILCNLRHAISVTCVNERWSTKFYFSASSALLLLWTSLCTYHFIRTRHKEKADV